MLLLSGRGALLKLVVGLALVQAGCSTRSVNRAPVEDRNAPVVSAPAPGAEAQPQAAKPLPGLSMQTVLKKISRFVILGLCFWLPRERKIRLERWLRGKEEFRKLELADCVIVSFGKSGRTWLRVLLSRFYQVRHGLSERHLIGFDNLHNRNGAIPRIFFTHDNYLKDYTGHAEDKRDYYGKKVILLARNPLDTTVSQFFQWKFRMRPG
jgi:hypothetical protein